MLSNAKNLRGQALRGEGFTTAASVMRAIGRGEIGGRPVTAYFDAGKISTLDTDRRSNQKTASDADQRAPGRDVNSLAAAREAAADFVGLPLQNLASGLVATVSKSNLLKMTSSKAVQKSTSLRDHVRAVANADELFATAELRESYPDRDGEPTIAAIHRFFARMPSQADGDVVVKMTVKETTGPREPNPLYTIETLEVEPSSVSVTSAPGQNRSVAPEGSNVSIGDATRNAKHSIPTPVPDAGHNFDNVEAEVSQDQFRPFYRANVSCHVRFKRAVYRRAFMGTLA